MGRALGEGDSPRHVGTLLQLFGIKLPECRRYLRVFPALAGLIPPLPHNAPRPAMAASMQASAWRRFVSQTILDGRVSATTVLLIAIFQPCRGAGSGALRRKTRRRWRFQCVWLSTNQCTVAPVILGLAGSWDVKRHPIVTSPLGRFTLHSHCGNSGS